MNIFAKFRSALFLIWALLQIKLKILLYQKSVFIYLILLSLLRIQKGRKPDHSAKTVELLFVSHGHAFGEGERWGWGEEERERLKLKPLTSLPVKIKCSETEIL